MESRELFRELVDTALEGVGTIGVAERNLDRQA
jgi:hypothetical protein